MEVTLPLDKMSVEDKIRTMEAIWEDLCKQADSIPSPDWHKDVLQQREEKIKNRNDEFMDWNDAKKHIKDSLT